MQVGTIENSGPNTLVSFLRNVGKGASQIDVAVAFVTEAGLDPLLYLLKQTAKRGNVRVLTGLYQGFTDPKALRRLLREQRETQERIAVRISCDSHFHWKTYFVRKGKTAHIIVGSSNLTSDGLMQSGEFNAVLSLPTNSTQFSRLHKPFERHWDSNSQPLSDEILGKYQAWRIENEVSHFRRTVPIRSILSAPARKRRSVSDQRERSHWQTWVNCKLSDGTLSLLAETTDWDKRGYSYFNTWKPIYSIGDQAILFDLGSRWLSAVEIVDTTTTPVRTPDGKHFAAYRLIKGIPYRRLVSNRWKSLKSAGLLKRKDDAYRARRLTKEKFDLFIANLNQS